MPIRYLMIDNGVEFQDEAITFESWGTLKPKMVCIQEPGLQSQFSPMCTNTDVK